MARDNHSSDPHVDLNGRRYHVSESRMERLRAMARERRISIEEAWAEILVSERL